MQSETFIGRVRGEIVLKHHSMMEVSMKRFIMLVALAIVLAPAAVQASQDSIENARQRQGKVGRSLREAQNKFHAAGEKLRGYKDNVSNYINTPLSPEEIKERESLSGMGRVSDYERNKYPTLSQRLQNVKQKVTDESGRYMGQLQQRAANASSSTRARWNNAKETANSKINRFKYFADPRMVSQEDMDNMNNAKETANSKINRFRYFADPRTVSQEDMDNMKGEIYEQQHGSEVYNALPDNSWGTYLKNRPSELVQSGKQKARDYVYNPMKKHVRGMAERYYATDSQPRQQEKSTQSWGQYLKSYAPRMPKAPSRFEDVSVYEPYNENMFAAQPGSYYTGMPTSRMERVEYPQTWGQYFGSYVPSMPKAPNRVQKFNMYQPADFNDFASQPATPSRMLNESIETPQTWREYLRLPKSKQAPRANENLEPITW